MSRRSTAAVLAALVGAGLGVAAASPAAADAWTCPEGTFRAQLTTEPQRRIPYVDDLVLCQEVGSLGGVLYNRTDFAWYPGGSDRLRIDVRPARGASAMYHAATEQHEADPYVHLLPGDVAWVSDYRDIVWWVDVPHTAGWMIAERLYDETRRSSLSAAGYLARGAGQASKAVWECTDGAASIGAKLSGEQIDGAELVDLALGGTPVGCRTAWESARTTKAAQKAMFPTFSTVDGWLRRPGDLDQLSNEIAALAEVSDLHTR